MDAQLRICNKDNCTNLVLCLTVEKVRYYETTLKEKNKNTDASVSQRQSGWDKQSGKKVLEQEKIFMAKMIMIYPDILAQLELCLTKET